MNNFNNSQTAGKFKMSSQDFSTRQVVAGLFQDRSHAQNAISALKSAGFPDSQIGLMMRDRSTRGDILDETGTHSSGEGTTAGMLSGGLLGGLIGLLVGIGSLAIPGVGPVIAGGFLAESLGSAAVGAGIGAIGGGILGSLVDMGLPEEEARHFESGFKSGGILVTVKGGPRTSEAAEILLRNGGDIGSHLDHYTSGTNSSTNLGQTNMQPELNTTNTTSNLNTGVNQTVQLREEELHARKQQVESGEVTLRKEVITEQKNIEVPVTREEVVIERHKVGDLPANSNIGNMGTEEVLRVPVKEEQVSVTKTPVVKEEISLGKRTVQETEVVSDTIRREEAHLEKTGNVDVRLNDDTELGRNNFEGPGSSPRI